MTGKRWLLGILCGLASLAGRFSLVDELPEEIICPAIRQDDRECHPNDPFEDTRQPELTVLGRSEHEGELTVEKVLYGSYTGKKLKYSSRYLDDKRGRRIFALVPRRYEEEAPYQLRYSVDAADEKAMRALAAARLDYNVLRAKCIFLGKETAALDEGRRRTVEVIRPLAGAAPGKGRRVTVALSGYPAEEAHKPLLREETLIYFAPSIHAEKDEKQPQTVYHVACRQPADQEEAVRAALARRKEYPVVDQERGTAYREVMFRGTTAEAIHLLGSEREAAVTLGARKLLHEPQKTRALVTADIERRLPQLEEKQHGDFRRLKNLIALLGHMKKEPAACDDLRRLLDQHLGFIAEQSRKLPQEKPEPPNPSRRGEEQREDVHHGLTWLVQQLSEEEVYSRYGQRLLQLRKEARGRWREEIQLALDVGKIEDHRELQVAFARMKNVKPMRSVAGMHHARGALAFSHDGKLLATAGKEYVRVWNTRDWSLAGQFAHEGSSNDRLRFSPDDRLLYAAGIGDPVLARFDWRSGKLDRAYTVHKESVCELELSADGRRLATASNSEDKICITDTQTGKLLKSWSIKESDHALTLSPDGKLLLRAAGPGNKLPERKADHSSREAAAWTAETLEGDAPALPDLAGKDRWLFSPAGRYLISVQAPSGDKDSGITLRVHDGSKKFAEIAKRKSEAFGAWLTVSDDGRRLAVANCGRGESLDLEEMLHPLHTCRVTIFSLPTLETISTCSIMRREKLELASMALSGDGKLLAVTESNRDIPYLFDAATGRRILPSAGHTDHIVDVYFASDGKTLRSLDNDNHICIWDAATMRLLRRLDLPVTFSVRSERPPDGKYLLCHDEAEKGGKWTLLTVDADTGKTVASIELPKYGGEYLWMSANVVRCALDKKIQYFDCRTGKSVKEIPPVKDFPPSTKYSRSADGLSLYCVDVFEGRYVEALSRNLAGGEEKTLASIRPESGAVNKYGMVPGGKYVYAGDPDLFLLEWPNMKVVAQRRFRKADLLDLAFTHRGDRYAVVTGGRIFIDETLRSWDPKTASIVRIHETLSGKTLAGFPTSTRWARVRFSPDDNRLAIINDDNTIEVWDLSKLPR